MMMRGIDVKINSKTVIWQVKGEIEADVYDTQRVQFNAGDVVIDIGAHIGLFSCWMAAQYPFLKIYAYEPVAETYAELADNANNYRNITTHNLGVGEPIISIQHLPDMSYCSSAFYPDVIKTAQIRQCKGVSLDAILSQHDKIKFLKMDCEGAEWDALLSSNLLDRVEYLGLEIHKLPQFENRLGALKSKLRRYFPMENISLHIVDKLNAEGNHGQTRH